MDENNDFRPDLIDFIKITLDEITETDLNKEEGKLLINKFYELYNDGFWDTQADIDIRNDIHLFIMGFKCYKIFKEIL